MSFEIRQQNHIEDELAKVVRRELGKAAGALTDSGGSAFTDAVHESRKRVKKVRAVEALLEDAGSKLPRKDHKRLKAAGSALSKIRDSAAIVDTLDRIHRRYPKQLSEHTYAILRRALVDARDREEAHAQRDGVVDQAAQQLTKTRKSAKEWTSPSIDVSDLIAVVAAAYRRSRNAMERARATGQSATLHRWRKELKTLWYQLRLAKPLTTGIASLIDDLKELETELGDDHNLVVLAATLRSCRDLRSSGAQVRQINRLAARMRQLLRQDAFARGRRLYARRPKMFTRWIRASSKPARRDKAAA
jgi:CHAD domain-containing protein